MASKLRIVATGVVASLALAVGCSSGGPATPDDPVLAQGQDVYEANCASCHGRDGGGGLGRKLAGEVEKNFPNVDDQVAVVREGRPGTNMPSFEGKLSDDEIQAVVRYTREHLG